MGNLTQKVTLNNLRKVYAYVCVCGVKATLRKIKSKFDLSNDYASWYEKHKTTEAELEEQRRHSFIYTPLLSVITPTFNTPERYLRAMIESVLAQTYANWELCIADGSTDGGITFKILQEYATKDERIKIKKIGTNGGISQNSNVALDMAQGDYIALFDHDDLLTPNALYAMVQTINDSDADFLYSDEDKTDDKVNHYFDPVFKSDFSWDFFRTNNYICHFTVLKRSLLEQAGKYFDATTDGAQDYDLFLRCAEKARMIKHLPQILYHWRIHPGSAASGNSAKPYTHEAGKRALESALARQGIKGKVVEVRDDVANVYKVKYALKAKPLVSIIIPTCNHLEDLRKCVASVIEKTSYKKYELLIVENNSTEDDVFSYYKKILQKNVRILYYPDVFNYAVINNWAIEKASGEYVVFLNNDVEIISADWLEELLMYAQREDVGAVGAKLLYPNGTVQHGGVIIGVGAFAEHAHVGLSANEQGPLNRNILVQNVSAVTAALMMTRKESFIKVGGFDERLTVAYNDVDLCLKLRAEGFQIVLNPDVQAYHYESKSRGVEDSKTKRQRAEQELALLRSKWGEHPVDPYYNVNLSRNIVFHYGQ